MLKGKKILAVLSVVGAVLCLSGKASAQSCEAELAARLKTDLSLSVKEFDQSKDVGWRVLEQKKCFVEAAQLIERYEQQHQAQAPFLEWHRAQLLASGGKYEQARAIALTTIRPEPGKYPPGFQWNDYVLAVISFWDGDRASFDNHADRVRHPGGEVMDMVKNLNTMNAKVLDRLAQCFTRPYIEALDCEPGGG